MSVIDEVAVSDVETGGRAHDARGRERVGDKRKVTPAADEVDALPVVSMVALPNELLQHIFKQACNSLEPRLAVALSSASHGLWALDTSTTHLHLLLY
eukprot:scaffold9046_cov64-Phaeocystis_antarctica.AAC.6